VTVAAAGEVPSALSRPTDSVRSTCILAVSITTTSSEFASVTYARGARGSTAIASGCDRCGPT